jgi:putative PEP-CTERM system histidine kinase
MTPVFFATTFLILYGVLIFFIQTKHYRSHTIAATLSIALLIPGSIMTGKMLFELPLRTDLELWLKLYGITSVLLHQGLIEFSSYFLKRPPVTVLFSWLRLEWLTRLLSTAGCLLAFFLPWSVPVQQGFEQLFSLTRAGIALYAIQFLLALTVVYILETSYHYAEVYQRRIARLCFLSLGVMGIYSIIFMIRTLLYQTLVGSYIEAGYVVYGVSFIVTLLGLIRYRLGQEQITISRSSVYSSITLLLSGALLLGLAATVFIAQRLGMNFSSFELFLFLFTIGFFAILAATSGNVRIRIIRFVNTHLYSLKYDYHDQFFRLHHTYMTQGDLQPTLIELVENIKYSVAVEDCFIFLLNVQDGNYYMHDNQESATPTNIHLDGACVVVERFKQRSRILDVINTADTQGAQEAMRSLPPEVQQLNIASFFPIFHQQELVGLLGIRSGGRRQYDEEDMKLINIFTLSIGNVFFNNRILNERIEHKQFESFNHVAAFIIHDIKNQVATLNLLVKNAEKNIDNPAFQQSLLKSLTGAATNLSGLIEKLKAPPKEERLLLTNEPLDPLIEEVIANSALHLLPHYQLRTSLKATTTVQIDRSSLFYIVTNLITNALEAMPRGGSLEITTGDAAQLPQHIRSKCHIGQHLLRERSVYITVSDTGSGMESSYLETKLFHPFATTKDKGVGIGLYQCKTLIEKMNGRILCHSIPQEGTTFCIVL